MVSSPAASVTAAGSPRATSSAKLGPDRIAGTAVGAHSAITCVMNLCVPRSMPLAQAITGMPAASTGASLRAASRKCCDGTASRIASCADRMAVSAAATVTRSSIRWPGRRGLSRDFAIAAALA